MRLLMSNLILGFSLLVTINAYAKGVYQQPDTFIEQHFNGETPSARVLWLSDDLRHQLEQVLQHDYNGRRIRYWQQGERSAWILEEVGKKKPITTGIVINSNKIEHIRVLVFRETRGWEVRYDFFTNQFIDARIDNNNTLDRHIDGISGATLSVRAVTKLARIALLLHKHLSS